VQNQNQEEDQQEEHQLIKLQEKKRRRDELSYSPGEGLKDERQKKYAKILERRAQKTRNNDGRMGEADRHIFVKKNKHLLAGKRGNGTNDRR